MDRLIIVTIYAVLVVCLMTVAVVWVGNLLPVVTSTALWTHPRTGR